MHPFNQTIPTQLAKGGRAIWGRYARHVMPEGIRFKYATAPQNIAKARESADWQDALDTLIDRVDAAGEFDLAMISCGGLGMLLGAHLRATNRSSMYHGGDLQIWFGIYGKRWAGISKMHHRNHSFYSNWLRPARSEVPEGAGAVEGGTYW